MTSRPFPSGPGATPLRDKTLWQLLRWWWQQPFEYEWVYVYAESRAWLRLDRMVIAVCCLLCGAVGATMLASTTNPLPWTVVASAATAWYLLAFRWWWANRAWPAERVSLVFIALGDLGAVPLIVIAPSALLAMALLCLYVLPGFYVMFLHSPKVLTTHLGWVTTVIVTTAAYFLVFSDHAVIPTVLLAAVLIFTCTGAFLVGQIALTFLRSDARNSFTDPLTGLLNRRGLDEAVTHALTRYPAGSVVTVMMVDIDHFKKYNDTQGHAMGDQLLREIALLLLRVCDSHSDALSRVGGDEFVAVLHLDKNTVMSLAYEILEEAKSIVMPETPTLSLGTFSDTADWPMTEDDARRIFDGADMALYASKRVGGGTVTAYPQ